MFTSKLHLQTAVATTPTAGRRGFCPARVPVRPRALRPGTGPGRRPAQTSRAGLGFSLLLAATVAPAQDSPRPTDKAGYNLVHPTPRERMRELSTDRPDQTESPYTVDAGHFQLEMDFVNAILDHDHSGGGDVHTERFVVAPFNLKLGLLNNVDVQFLLDPFVQERLEDREAGTTSRSTGLGDFQTRLKINLWGNDGGRTALAIMPFVKWPLPESSLRNGKTEGGVIVPLAVELPRGWGLGLMTEFDFVRNEINDGYDTEFVHTVTFGHDLAPKLGGYVEFISVVSTAADSEWRGLAALGFTYGIDDHTQLDFGCNFGVTDAAPDFAPFAGLSWRF